LVVVVVAVVALGGVGLLLPSIEAPSIEAPSIEVPSIEVPFVEESTKVGPSSSIPEKKEVERKPVTIRVTGTSGVSFSGNYSAGGSSGTIDGVTPQDFQAETRTGTDSVSANAQKRDEGNEELTLQVIVDGEVVKEQSTTAQFGVVYINLFPDEI
jgi:hypothetical protein